MKQTITILACILLSFAATAQTTTNGALRQSSTVVTNEVDALGIQFARTNLVTKIHNPANVAEWIDGAGNKYVVSNFWEFIVSDTLQDMNGARPSITNVVLTSTSETQTEFIDTYNYWRFLFIVTEGGYRYPSLTRSIDITTENNWIPASGGTNLVSQDGGVGYVIYRTFTTTNLVGNLATREWAAANYATPTSVSNQIAQSSSANFVVRMTAVKTTAFTFAPTNGTYVGDSSGSILATNAVVSVLAGNVGDYVLAFGDTNNTFTTVQGTYVNADIYANENEAGDQQYKLEIYRRDLETDVMSEWGDGGPTFTIPASMGKTSISIYVPSVSTNAFRVWARLKRIGGSATSARNLYIGTGTGTPTFFSLTIPASVPIDVHNADPLAHPTMIRSSLTWTAAGTNATYRMYWDATNGTFTVQEILP